MTAAGANAELVDAGDIDELTRHVGRLAAAHDWDGLVDLRDRCRAALERGRQLWGVASWCEYRLALDAPGRWAGAVLQPDAGRFAFGPLAEVAASTHTWDELAPTAPGGPTAAVAAHERVVRGEDLTDDGRVPVGVIDLPLRLAPWEPRYPVATYTADGADFGDVALPDLEPLVLPGAGTAVDDPDGRGALLDLATTWVASSSGQASATTVRGDAASAIAAVTKAPIVRAVQLDPSAAVAYLAWTGASGGAHGRRRGLAAGRFAAWWTAAALTDLLGDWPPDPDELGAAVAELTWWQWDDRDAATGWWLGLAVEDPVDGLAWAVRASDARV